MPVSGGTRWLLRLGSAITLAFLYLPLVVIVIYAFNKTTVQEWPPAGLSLRWFDKGINNPGARDALWTSVKVGLGAIAWSAGPVSTVSAATPSARTTAATSSGTPCSVSAMRDSPDAGSVPAGCGLSHWIRLGNAPPSCSRPSSGTIITASEALRARRPGRDPGRGRVGEPARSIDVGGSGDPRHEGRRIGQHRASPGVMEPEPAWTPGPHGARVDGDD